MVSGIMDPTPYLILSKQFYFPSNPYMTLTERKRDGDRMRDRKRDRQADEHTHKLMNKQTV